jgi:hypothetical protein
MAFISVTLETSHLPISELNKVHPEKHWAKDVPGKK